MINFATYFSDDMILLTGIKFTKIRGIALWPFVLVQTKNPGQILINHERIHLRQQAETGIILFYFWYVTEWLWHFVRLRNWWAAYHQISFEKEAYRNETNLDYLKNRKLWSFVKYIR